VPLRYATDALARRIADAMLADLARLRGSLNV